MGLVCLLAALYIFINRANRPDRDFPRASRDFMGAAKAERRLAELAKTIASDPDDMLALAESGRLKYQLGQDHYIGAIADLERARALGLCDPRVSFYLGGMYQSVGLYDFSAQEYRKFLNNFPGDGEARMLLAKLCYASGDFAGAEREYETLLKNGKDDPVILENLALARWKNNLDYAPALADLRAKGQAGGFLADYAEGRINYEIKNYTKASFFLKKAAASSQMAAGFAGQAELLWLAADASYKDKDTAGAYDCLQRLLQAAPAHEEGRSLLVKLKKTMKPAVKSGGRK